jgi:putative membrane protein
MYVKRRINIRIIWAFGWFNILIFTLISLFVVLLYLYVDCLWIAIPFLPVSLIGTATAFYIGLKNNSSYDRLWEARRLWGSIVNDSRAWALSVRDYLQHDVHVDSLSKEEVDIIKKRLIYRHIAYVNAMRVQLRRRQTWEHDRRYNNVFREKTSPHFGPVEMIDSIERFLDKEELAQALSAQSAALFLMS